MCAGRCLQDSRDDIEARLNGDDHPRLEIEVEAQVSGTELARAGPVLGVRCAIPEVLEIVNIEPEEVSDAVWKKEGMRLCLHGGVGVTGQQALVSQEGREDSTALSVYIPIAGTGANEGDALSLCLENGIVRSTLAGLNLSAHRPRACDVFVA